MESEEESEKVPIYFSPLYISTIKQICLHYRSNLNVSDNYIVITVN